MSYIPLLYVTSFNKKLYEASGQKLIKSFIVNRINEKFLITYEDGINQIIKKKDNFIFYNLEQDAVLKFWLDKYKNVIPSYYGGSAEDCVCHIDKSDNKADWDKHKPGCAHSQWNKRASHWFRKIVALNHALTLNPEKIVFLDSDVYFIKHLPTRILVDMFREDGLIYHLGKFRKEQKTSIESGIIGFSRKGGGFDYLRKVIKCFLTGDFLKYIRWDDGFIFKQILEDTPVNRLGRRDLVINYRRTSHVVNLGMLRNFLIHDKGHHLRIHKIV